MIRLCHSHEIEEIGSIINDGAQAYRGIIPADRWSEPYMPFEKLQHEIEDGVAFWGFEDGGMLQGVMDLQSVRDVTLIRHAYVRTAMQGRGIGGMLLRHLQQLASGPLLVGTWADAVWAIRLYEKYGFALVNAVEKEKLLRTYWTVPDRQIETSVVLADSLWRESR